MKRIAAIFILATSLTFTACTQAATAELPNQIANAVEDDMGNRSLIGWSSTEITSPAMRYRWTPDNAAFTGAELWFQHIETRDFEAATKTALERAGFKKARTLATAKGNPIAMDVLDAHPDAMYNTIMLEGSINGEPAHAIALVTYGKTDDGSLKSGVHAFLAPKEKFKALGGYAVPAVYWLQASNQPGTDMREDGGLPPQEAVNTFSTFFARYVEAYVVPMMQLTMQIHMNTIQNMQSWNTAMNACAGDPACTVSPTTDGSGNWEPVVQ